jgi:hypothetical protein
MGGHENSVNALDGGGVCPSSALPPQHVLWLADRIDTNETIEASVQPECADAQATAA